MTGENRQQRRHMTARNQRQCQGVHDANSGGARAHRFLWRRRLMVELSAAAVLDRVRRKWAHQLPPLHRYFVFHGLDAQHGSGLTACGGCKNQGAGMVVAAAYPPWLQAPFHRAVPSRSPCTSETGERRGERRIRSPEALARGASVLDTIKFQSTFEAQQGRR
jgi:hypothetical protein